MKTINVAGKALSPFVVIGVIVVISALIGAAVSVIFSTQVASSTVVNSSLGITVTPKDWNPGSDTGYPYASEATLTLGTTYSMAVELKSYGAYDGVTPTFTITKSDAPANLANTDVVINIYYTDTISWINPGFDFIDGNVGTVTTNVPTDVMPGDAVTFYVEITYWATGHYDLVVSGTGTNA